MENLNVTSQGFSQYPQTLSDRGSKPIASRAFTRGTTQIEEQTLYLSTGQEQKSNGHDSDKIRNHKISTIATVKNGIDSTKARIDKDTTNWKDTKGSRGTGRWHEYNGPKSKSPCAGCRPLNFHHFKNVK